VEGPSSPKSQPAKARWWRRPAVVITAVGILLAVIATVAAVTLRAPAKQSGPTARQQRTLPFIGVTPHGLALDSNGTLYVTDDRSQRVLSLAAGSSNQNVLPFNGLEIPDGVAVHPNGSVYVADHGSHPVVALLAGSTTQIVLPFSGLNHPSGVAVDNDGTVYVADNGNGRVVSLAAQ